MYTCLLFCVVITVSAISTFKVYTSISSVHDWGENEKPPNNHGKILSWIPAFTCTYWLSTLSPTIPAESPAVGVRKGLTQKPSISSESLQHDSYQSVTPIIIQIH